MANLPATVIALEGLGKTFDLRRGAFSRRPEAVIAVDDVWLKVGRGEALGLAGESGSGKSTLALMMLGLAEPSAGRVMFDGRDLYRLARAERRDFRRRVQIIFQDPYASFDPRMRVRAILSEAMPREVRSDKERRQRREAELFEMVGLAGDASDRFPHEFSGGQRQRIAIARALAAEPEVLVLDEPVSALDVSVQAQVLNLLRDLRESLGLTYVLISHDLDVIYYLCDRVAVMYLGRIVEVGPADRVMFQPQHPYTELLIAASPRVGGSLLQLPEREIEVAGQERPGSGCVFAARCLRRLEVCVTDTPDLVRRNQSDVACWNPVQGKDIHISTTGASTRPFAKDESLSDEQLEER